MLNKDSLMEGFDSLGIKKGDSLLVHSSITAMGNVEGGAHTVIQALMEGVGSDGTLVLPSLNWDYFQAPEKVIDLVNTPPEWELFQKHFA